MVWWMSFAPSGCGTRKVGSTSGGPVLGTSLQGRVAAALRLRFPISHRAQLFTERYSRIVGPGALFVERGRSSLVPAEHSRPPRRSKA